MKAEAQLPLVSVIVCVYNAGRFLRASILSLLAQTHRSIEIIVVDDGSTDECIKSIDDLTDERIRIVAQPNRGKPAAMNVAIRHARGEFYALQDADDVSDPTRIEKQARCLQRHPHLAACFCGHGLILNDRPLAPTFPAKDVDACREDIEGFRMPGHDPTAMYRLSMVGDIRYDESLPIVEGFDYVLRVGERFPMQVLGECLYGYRIHPDSVTKRDPHRRDSLVVELLRRACERRGRDPKAALPHLFKDGATWTPCPDNNLATHFMESACDLKRAGRRGDALRVGFACARLRPFVFQHYKALIYAAMPAWLVTASRRQAGS